MKKILLFLLLVTQVFAMQAQSTKDTAYDPQKLFAESFHMPEGNAFRSAKGTPGPMYWQNTSSYLIHAALSEKDTSVTGDVTITYTNNSPDALDYLWLQLDQDIFKSGSRAAAATRYPGDYFGVMDKHHGGYELSEVTVIQAGKSHNI